MGLVNYIKLCGIKQKEKIFPVNQTVHNYYNFYFR